VALNSELTLGFVGDSFGLHVQLLVVEFVSGEFAQLGGEGVIQEQRHGRSFVL